MSECIRDALTLRVGSSAWWNISLATVSNPVYCEASAVLHRLRDTMLVITGGALTGLCRLNASSGCLCMLEMHMNTLLYKSLRGELLITPIVTCWLTNRLYIKVSHWTLQFPVSCYPCHPYCSHSKNFDSRTECKSKLLCIQVLALWSTFQYTSHLLAKHEAALLCWPWLDKQSGK